MTDFEAPDFDASTSSATPRSWPTRIPTSSTCASSARCCREPHHDVVMVTGYEEAISVYHDTAHVLLVQLRDRAVPGLPRAARR